MEYGTIFALVFLCCNAAWSAPTVVPVVFAGVASPLNTGGISLNGPSAVFLDGSGNVYIADTNDNQIVTLAPNGSSSVLNITGLDTPLSSPGGMALDVWGNLLIADTGNGRIVEVSPGGSATVLSLNNGITLSAPQGVLVDPAGDVFISDTGNSRIVELSVGGSAEVYAITGLSSPVLASPAGLAVDLSGNLYIADSGHDRVVEVTPAGEGSVLSMLGVSSINNPSAVAVDSYGNVLTVDSGNNRIVVTPSGGVNSSVLPIGSLTLNDPVGVAVDAFGNVYVADTGDNVAVYDQIRTVGFGHTQLGSTTSQTFLLPFTVQAITDLTNLTITTLGTSGRDFTVGSGGTTPCTAGTYGSKTTCTIAVQYLPVGPGFRQGGMILTYVYAGKTHTLTVPLYGFADAPQAALSPGTASVISTGGVTLNNPYQIAIDGSGNVYVGSYVDDNVVKIAAGGGSASVVSIGSYPAMGEVAGVAVDGAGDLFISDSGQSLIYEVTSAGIISQLTITAAGDQLLQPTALAVDAAGNLFIADYGNSRVVKLKPPDVPQATSPSSQSLTGTVVNTNGSKINGLAVDASENLYITDRDAGVIIKVTLKGEESIVAVPGLTLDNPEGVAVDGMGNIYIADSGNSRIVQVTTAGVASVVPIQGLTNPTTIGSAGGDLFGVSVDSSGNIYIADWPNNRVVEVDVSGASLAFASTIVGSTSSDSPKTATVTNLGNEALVFSAAPAYTASFSENTSDSNLCTSSTSLAAGTVCDVAVEFTPQSVGSLSANITTTNNNLNVSGSTQQVAVSGTGLSPDTTTMAVSVNPTAANIGQPLTIMATVRDTTTGHTATVPTGSVVITDTVGLTVVQLNNGNPVGLNSGVATLAGATLSDAGTHTITANYGGVSGTFLSSSNSINLTVSKTPVTVTGPASQPVQVTAGQAGSVSFTVTGPYSGLAMPTGSLSYNVLNASNTSVASGSATLTAGGTSSTASVPIANTLAAGTYTLSVSYGGDGNYAASSTPVTVQILIGQITPTISWTPSAAITYGTSLSGVLNAAAFNGSTSVAGTFAYTATPQGGNASAVTSATVLGAGTYTLTATFTPTNTSTYTSAIASASLTVSKTTPTITLTSSANPVLLKNAVSFTATVSFSAGTPTGLVSFYDGTTLLGSSTLAQGAAGYTTSSLAAGSHTVTAVYAGDNNFAAVTSSAVTQAVDDFSLNLPAGSSGSETVSPGGAATYTLVIAPSGGSTIPGPVTLAVSGLPSGATATFTPQVLSAGSGLTNVTLLVHTSNVVASLLHRNSLAAAMMFPMLGVLLLPFGGKLRPAVSKRGRGARLLFLVLLATLLIGLAGCGGLAQGNRGGSQSYQLTVTATSGSLSHSTTLNLTIQ